MSDIVCAANRDLASRVRRLLDPSGMRLRAAVTGGAALMLCVSATATTLVAFVAPGLPLPRYGDHRPAGAMLISSRDLSPVPKAGIQPQLGAPASYDREATGTPFRLTAVEAGDAFTFQFVTAANIFPKRIVSLGVGADATAPREAPGMVVVGLRSTPVDVSIEPGKAARVSISFIAAAELDLIKHQLGEHVQFKVYPAYARFEDGTSWVGAAPPPPARLTIPEALVSTMVPASSELQERIPVCYDAEGKQTSEGGIAPIREDNSRWVRCTNGRWVPTKSPVPPDAKLTPAPVH